MRTAVRSLVLVCSYIWLLLLPFGFFPEASWWSLMPISVMAAMMLGLEDLAVQMEDPFKVGCCFA